MDELEDDLFCLRLLEEARNGPRDEFEDFDIFDEQVKANWKGAFVMEYIRPSTDLRDHYSEISRDCRESREPVFITVDGREDTVIMDSAVFRRMRAQLELYELLAKGEEDIRNGRVEPFEGTFDEFSKRLMERWNNG